MPAGTNRRRFLRKPKRNFLEYFTHRALFYVGDLAPVCLEVARVLEPGGLFAFTLETHDGGGLSLGDKLRYQHGVDHVRAVLTAACLVPIELAPVSTRTEGGVPVPGLLVIARRATQASPSE